jgi:hypothetical protein
MSLRPIAKTYIVVAVLIGWQSPAEFRGLTRAQANTLSRFFEDLGASVVVMPEG